jgi:hypothetical protein
MVVVAGLFIAVRWGPDGLVGLYVFLVPWFGLQANLGVTVAADRFIAFMLIAVVILRRGANGFTGFGLFYLFITVNTVAQSLYLPTSARDFPPLQGEWRWLLQLVMWTLLIAPGAIIGASREQIAKRVYEVLVVSTTILASLAILQFTLYYATGFDLFPLNLFTPDSEYRAGAFDTIGFLGGHVFRACALGGEPKHLAYSLAISLAILGAEQLFGGLLSLSRWKQVFAASIQGVALLLTFSTQGLGLLAFNIVLLLGMAAVKRGHTRRQIWFFVLVATGALAIVAVPGLTEIVRMRSVDRLIETRGLEDWNIAVLDWLIDNTWAVPLGVGLGNVHLYAAPYIPAEFLYYMGGHVFVAKSGFLRIVSEAGIVGLLLFFASAVPPLKRLWRKSATRGSPSGGGAALLVLVLLDYMLAADGPTYVFIAIGAAWAISRVHSRLRLPMALQATTGLT